MEDKYVHWGLFWFVIDILNERYIINIAERSTYISLVIIAVCSEIHTIQINTVQIARADD